MANNFDSLEKMKMAKFTEGVWYQLEEEEKRKKEANLLERMAETSRKKAREEKARTAPTPTSNNAGLVKLLRDWEHKYHRFDQ